MSSQVTLVKANKLHITSTQPSTEGSFGFNLGFLKKKRLLTHSFALDSPTLWIRLTPDYPPSAVPLPQTSPHLSFPPLPPILQSDQTAFLSPPELPSFLWPACTRRQLYWEPASPAIHSLLLMARQRKQSLNAAAVRTDLGLLKEEKNIRICENCW